MLGPGWASIAPQETVGSGNATAGPGDALTLNAAAGMAFAVYGIANFDGDNGPTSARITQTAITGRYFIGFSDYVAGTWRFAGPFTGSATAEIPLPDGSVHSEYMSPKAFTSSSGTCYFVVAVPEGGSLQLTRTELGVHGGVLGPEPTTFDSAGGGTNGCLLHWRPSPSCKDADFAGYRLERAPLLYGNFAPLHTGLLPDEYFLDTTGDIDTKYRYRLAVVDASGNQSIWASTVTGAFTGLQANPVPVLKLPRGPLYSPAKVTLDMSESFDPEGAGITDYAFTFLLYPPSFNGADPTPTVTLPPGCHAISATVTTGDGRTQSTVAYLKVYPTRATTPSVVVIPDAAASTPRIVFMRGAL